MTDRACVYTVLMGDYEGLNEQPVARSADLDFICFTDNHSIESQTWKIIHVEAAWPTDAVRSARALKVLGHPALDEYSRTIWMDNSIVLLSDPSFLLSHLEKAPLVLLDHPFRETVADEFAEVIAVGYDDQARVIEQRNAYALVNPRVLEEDVLATGIMVRRRSSEVTTTMRVWMDHILRYSRRDQLSINYVLATTGTPFLRIFEDLRAVTWASWPHTPERDRSRGLRDPLVLQQPPFLLAAQIRERERSLETRLRDVTRERDILRSEAVAMAEIRARELDHAASAARQATDERCDPADNQHDLAAARDQIRSLATERAHLLASRSWRFTRPFRLASARLRPRRESHA